MGKKETRKSREMVNRWERLCSRNYRKMIVNFQREREEKERLAAELKALSIRPVEEAPMGEDVVFLIRGFRDAQGDIWISDTVHAPRIAEGWRPIMEEKSNV